MNTKTVCLACSLLLSAAIGLKAQLLAFPGAEGFGRFAKGGRTGTVYHVTNLNDSGTGSFRDAVSRPNRIVVFDVAGVIRINSRISVAANIYIAGQTAPGEGVTIYGNGISFSDANNTICRYLRVRQGVVGTSDTDACGISSGSTMIFDHCSFSWGRDEVFSISGSSPSDITVQNCIIGQGLMGHSAGGLMQSDNRITIYRTLYIHNDTRNPKFKGRHQYVNNIVYNWKTAAYIMGGDSEGTSWADAVGNLFITGPTGRQNAFSGANARYNIYAKDNLLDDNQDGQLNPRPIAESEFGGGPTFLSQSNGYPQLPTLAAADLYADLVPTVGASLPYRDPLDWMLIEDLRSLGTEGDIISNESTLDIGAPTDWNLWKGESRADTDGDGMPDWWEAENGTDDCADDAMVLQPDGYTNIEHYINSLTAADSQPFLKAPVALKTIETTQDQVSLRWRDFTDYEDGYVVEQQVNGTFTEIARTDKDVHRCTVTALQPLTTYVFRVRAFQGDSCSAYSNTLSVTTRAQQAEAIDPEAYVPDLVWDGLQSSVWSTEAANWLVPADSPSARLALAGLPAARLALAGSPSSRLALAGSPSTRLTLAGSLAASSVGGGLPVATTFSDGLSVLFDDSGASTTVDIPAAVSPAAVMVKGQKDYTLNGVIAGTGSMNMAGTGTLKLGSANTYSGNTVVWGGTLEIGKLANGGQPSSIGTAQNWIWNGGTIRYTGGNVTTNREAVIQQPTTVEVKNTSTVLTLTGELSGDGDLVKTGPGTLSQAIGLHTYTGNTIVREGTYEVKGKDLIGNQRHIKGRLILEGGRFRCTGGDNNAEGYLQGFPIEVRGDKASYFHADRRIYIKNPFSGTGNLTLEVEYVREFYQGDWREYFGTVTAKQTGSGGNQFYVDNATYGGMPNARLVLQGALEMRGGSNGKTYQIGALSGTSATTLACCFVKKDGGTVTWRVGGLGTDETYSGKITNGIEHTSRIGTTSIVKEGEGYWRLTGANRYRGTTQVNGGMLILNGTHTQDKDHTGTYFTPGQYTVNAGATLAGRGSTEAPVVVKRGGTLAPGDGGNPQLAVGTLTVKNNVTMQSGSQLVIEVNRAKRTQDRLTTTGTLTAAGDLCISLVDGQFAEGDQMIILSAKTYKGAFDRIIPESPGSGLLWDTSELLTKGRLSVVTTLGITNVNTVGEPVRTEYFTADGTRVNSEGDMSDAQATKHTPQGTAPLLIVRKTYADGTVRTTKTAARRR